MHPLPAFFRALRSRTPGTLVYLLATALVALCSASAFAWGPEGHAIVAEIAQRRLSPPARAEVERLLVHGSLASVASWADDVRDARPETASLHFVNIPRGKPYEAARDCIPGARGDCVVAALERLRGELRCGGEEQRRDALRFAVHFVGDLHQPLHSAGEERGGNTLTVQADWRGLACTGRCNPKRMETNLHVVWDSLLITTTTWNWGAYVERLEQGWLRGAPAGVEGGTVADWANASRAQANQAWDAMPADRVLDTTYYNRMLPILDQQLGSAGLRLARYLNETLAAPAACPAK